MEDNKRITARSLQKLKQSDEKIVALTAYDYYTAKFLEEAGVDFILVGDSLNMVIYGEENTLNVEMDKMIYHTEAVSSATEKSMVVGDMPFMSYQASTEEAVKNAGAFLKEGGAQAVKLEGGTEMAGKVEAIYNAGIPVVGHIGLQPQSIHKYGSYRTQGTTNISKNYLRESAEELQSAGCCAIILENIKSTLAKKITEDLTIPTIGIGAGPHCDGQILVINDIIGMFDRFKPEFARKYTDFKSQIIEVASQYAEDVRKDNFPGEGEFIE